MHLKSISVICNAISATAAIAAAALWFKSAAARVDARDRTTGVEVIVSGYAFIATAQEQAKWNKLAASAAAVAAIFQACGMVAGMCDT
jgi:hypothetical protein